MKWLSGAAAAAILAGAALAQQADIATSMGTVTIALDRAHAPATVDNFVRYAKEGHFDGTLVYRVVPFFVVQAGSYGADGIDRPLHPPIPLEAGQPNARGTVAMARDPDMANSATAEFFINLEDNQAGLDAKPGVANSGFAVFGHVTAGMDVVDAIAKVATGGGKGPFPEAQPTTPIVIRTVTIRDTPGQ
jgi:cyclophilin family peptidyl-prolyl cis-trans isomerase